MKADFNCSKRFFPAVIVAVLCLMVAPLALSQQYEYEPDQGLHQEEWYDPSDWFDNDAGIDYETDWHDYTYNYPETYIYEDDQAVRGYYGVQEEYPYEIGDSGGYRYYDDTWFDNDAGDFNEWYE